MPVFNEVQMRAISQARLGFNLFITGPAGTGKSFVLRTIVEQAEKAGRQVQVTASTGLAASLLSEFSSKGARTLHSFTGVRPHSYGGPVKTPKEIADKLRTNRVAFNRIREIDILIIDECSMIPTEYYKILNDVFKIVRRNEKFSFGGVQIILAGDFFQLGPVQKRSVLPIFMDPLWKEMINETIFLKEIYRQKSGDFLSMLSKLRIGVVDREVSDLVSKTSNNKLVNEHGIKPTLLCACNVDVDKVNDTELMNLPGEMVEYKSIDTNVYANQNPDALPFRTPERLRLKVGAQVMMVANVNPEVGFVNGARGVVTSITSQERVMVRLLTGREVSVYKYLQEFDIDGCSHKVGAAVMKCSRLQFPLKLAWAVTIHKSQGQTIDYLIVDLNKVFAPGQAYTAISRGSSLENMIIRNFHQGCVIADREVVAFHNKLTEKAKKEEQDRSEVQEPKRVKLV